MSLYSVVVPVYNSEHTLEELYERVKAVFEDTIHQPFEMVLVDDGSKDRSWEVMESLHAADPRVKIIQQARNFGQHPALLCGFHYVQGDFVITMDDDLQHPPEEIPKLVQVMNERDDVDVIIAKYEGRHHNLIRRMGTAVSVYATSKMLGKPKDLEITSFRLIRRFIVDAIINMNVRLPQIGNLLVQTSNRIINVPVKHDARKYGHSGYSFRRLAHDLFYDIISNSAFPLMLVRDIGIVSFLFSLVLALYFLIRFFMFGRSVEGWTSSMLIMLAFFGLTLLSIGIMGEYLMHILDETKKMPNYVERQKKL
ncbi:MAG: glycosyltransferase family 2 protein [Lachnospiraceae bacterium]|nr:glycosyltransferase family 2 protein [Lachnospiraceae bacterium]